MSSRLSNAFARLTSNWPVKILSVTAAIVLHLAYRIGSLEERFFSVPLEVVTNSANVAVGEVVGSVRVTLRGPADDIFLILENDIEVYVDLTRHGEGRFRVPVMVRKMGTAENSDLEVAVQPLEVTVTQEALVRIVRDVFPEVIGTTSQGFELVEYLIEPPTVEIEGPRSIVEEVESIETVEIDLSRRAADFSVRASLVSSDAFDIIGAKIVEFSAKIRPVVVVERFESIEIVVDSLAPGLTALLSESEGSMRVRGESLLLETLNGEEFRLHVDAAEIDAAGVYELTVTAEPLEGTEIVAVAPARISLTVTEDQLGEVP